MYAIIRRKFEKIGARAVFKRPEPIVYSGRNYGNGAFRVDIGADADGDFFELTWDPRRDELLALDVRPRQQRLLLMSRRHASGAKAKFLCGFEERHWFVAAVPSGPASSVESAMDALMPAEVRRELDRRGVRRKLHHKRRNAAFVRQGEWFFVPVEHARIPERLVMRNEELRRGRGTPHRVEYLYRRGARSVYVCRQYPDGVPEHMYAWLIRRRPGAHRWNWRQMQVAFVYVRGRVRHPDHRTVELAGWHQVVVNTEHQAPGMRYVGFLD